MSDTQRVPVPEVPQVPFDSVRFVYHSGYYDGPLSGACEVDGRRLWFDMFDENYDSGTGWGRRYALIDMPPEWWAWEDARHASFREHVGVHTDYGPDRRRPVGALRPQSEWSKYYDAYKDCKNPHAKGTAVGWFEW